MHKIPRYLKQYSKCTLGTINFSLSHIDRNIQASYNYSINRSLSHTDRNIHMRFPYLLEFRFLMCSIYGSFVFRLLDIIISDGRRSLYNVHVVHKKFRFVWAQLSDGFRSIEVQICWVQICGVQICWVQICEVQICGVQITQYFPLLSKHRTKCKQIFLSPKGYLLD